MAFDSHADRDGHESPELMDMSGEDEFEDDGGSTHSSMADLIEDAQDANWDQLLGDMKDDDENDDDGDAGDDGGANNNDDMQDEKQQNVQDDGAPAQQQQQQGAPITWDADIIAPVTVFLPIVGIGQGTAVIKWVSDENGNTTGTLVQIKSFTNSNQLS